MVDADERLLVEAAQRDPSRFADLYERHFDEVYAFLVRRVRDRSIAEELTAEVFYKAFAGLRNYQWRGAPFGAWLLRIATNALFDRSKRVAREVSNVDDLADPAADAGPGLIGDRARLFRLVDRLPADQRTVIVQRFVEERSIRDIARRLERTEGAVKQLQFRGIQTLRKWMDGHDA